MSLTPPRSAAACMNVNMNFTEISVGSTGNHTKLKQIGLADI